MSSITSIARLRAASFQLVGPRPSGARAQIRAKTSRGRLLRLGLSCVAALVFWTTAAALAAANDQYHLGVRDVLQITIWGPRGLSEKFVIEADGVLTFPMLGRVTAAGLTVQQLQQELVRRLAEGYYKNPEVTVAVAEFRSQRVYVVGEVRSPGSFPLEGSVSLMEMLARAGSATAGAGDFVAIRRRAQSGTTSGPALADTDAAEVISVSIADLAGGGKAHDVMLQDGDTVVVSSGKTIFVFGYVTRPGEYRMQRDTTVLQALSLAGGVNERGSTRRLKVIRVVDGEKRELGISLDDLVQPGDTIMVPKRLL